MLDVDVTQIPQEMRNVPNWVCWKKVPNPKSHSGVDKFPVSPVNGYGAKANDPTTWTTFDAACRYAQSHDDIAGIGFEFGGSGFVGIDVDDRPLDSPEVQDVLHGIPSYAEFSQSGNGIHILCSGSLPGEGFNNRTEGIEMYSTGRFFVVTGNRVSDETHLIDCTDHVKPYYEKYKTKKEKPKDKQTTGNTVSMVSIQMSDRELIDKAINSKGGDFFKSLYDGAWNGEYESQSEADLAFCCKLAFWTGKNEEQMDRIFRSSGLMRDKWDRKQAGTTYGALTISKACNTVEKIYEPKTNWGGSMSYTNQAPDFLDGIEGYDEVDVGDDDRTPEQPPQPKEKMGVQTFQDFLDKIQTEAYKPLSTGLQSFDEMLGGGIPRQSIVILTAAPGAGKTALTQQVFETMAAGGANVLFINLEMSREQLMARSLSRIIRRQGGRMSATAIMRGYKWTDEQRQYMQYAAEEYRERLADHIVYNPVESTDIEKILATINDIAKKCKDAGKEVPVVVLDYLHLVTAEKSQEQAEIIKRAVAGLKQYAINYDTFCFVISANNREANKNGVITLNSGRDTSAIEYSADIQISLNYREFAEPKKFHKRDGHRYDPQDPNDVEELQRMNPRHMVIQTLKNRMCGISKKLYMEFDAECSTFTAVEPEIPNAGFTVSFGKNSHRNPKSFLDEIECIPSEDGGLCEIRRKDEEEDYL